MSAFRNIAPSQNQDKSTADSQAPMASLNSPMAGGLGGEASSSAAKDAGGGSVSGGDGNPRRKRTPGSVSLMACTPCRTARQRVSK